MIRAKKVLILGNGPSLKDVPLDASQHKTIWTVAVNRIKGAYKPDFLLICDNTIQAEWLDCGGQLVVWEKCKHAAQPGAITFATSKFLKEDLQISEEDGSVLPPWPRDGQALLSAGTTPSVAVQWAVNEMRPKSVGLIGIEHNARLRWRAKKDTHWYGVNPEWDRRYQATGQPQPGFLPRAFEGWQWVYAHLQNKGIGLYNLCPYGEETPFNRVGIPLMDFEEWCLS